MSSSWTDERREAQRQRARKLYEEGKFGGPNRGQGRKPKRRLDLSASTCPHCGGSLEGVKLDAGRVDMRRSFYTRYDAKGDIEIVYLDDDDRGFDDVALSEAGEVLHKGQSVSVVGRRGSITGFSRDREHIYVRFGKTAKKVPVDEVTPVR